MGGAAGYVIGDMAMIERMAVAWDVLAAAIDLPEHQPAMSRDDYVEILNAMHQQ